MGPGACGARRSRAGSSRVPAEAPAADPDPGERRDGTSLHPRSERCRPRHEGSHSWVDPEALLPGPPQAAFHHRRQ